MALDKDLLRSAARDAVPVSAGGGPPPRPRRSPRPPPPPRSVPDPVAPPVSGAAAAQRAGWRNWLSLLVVAAVVWSCVSRRASGPEEDAASVAPAADAAAVMPEPASEPPSVYDSLPPDPGAPLLGDDLLEDGVNRLPTSAGLLRVVAAADGTAQLLELDGQVVDGISGPVVRLARRLSYGDREVVVGFTGCDEPTPACALSRPFWLVLREGETPRAVEAPDLAATVEAGAVAADANGVRVDLGIFRGEQFSATLTQRDLLHAESRPAQAAALGAAQCATVARALEDCTRAAPEACGTPEGSTTRIDEARRLALGYLFEHTMGFDEPAFAALCARSCELGATPSDKLIREELCSGADPGQWSSPTLPWLLRDAAT